MKQTEWWKNFRLGEELGVSGAFIYNGLRRFHSLHKLDHADDLFEVFYNLSVGFERLLKIVIVLLEHDEARDQDAFEESIITHNHHALLTRIKKHMDLKFSKADNAFLNLLTAFYENLRYDRFSLKSRLALGKEKNQLFDFLEQQLKVTFEDRNSVFGHENTDQFKKFLRKIVVKISSALYEIVQNRARELNLYTYELRSGSKAEAVFLGKADITSEEMLWKELLVFFMNTKETSGYLRFLRGIEPLKFDPGLVSDYLDCFQSESARADVADELETLYEDVEDKRTRIAMIGAIGAPNVSFDDDDENGGEFEEIEGNPIDP